MVIKASDTKATGRAHLTLERIRKMPTPEGQAVYYFDDDPRQLCVRVTANGAKSYVYRGKLAGDSLRLTIGSTDVWNLDGARTEARRLQTLIDNGDGPREVQAEKQAAKDAKRAESKRRGSHALDVWLEYAELRRANWSKRHHAEHLLVAKEGGEHRTRGRRTGESDVTTAGILRPLLELPIQSIDADKVRQWLKDESAKRPTYARLAFSLLRAFLNWCADRPEYRAYVHADACAARLARDELPKKSAKDDCLQREQLPLWFEHVRKLANPVHSAYLQALLLTGARREELAALRWDDCDFQWRSLNIHDKVEGQRMIPLTPYVSSLLCALPRRNEFVFASTTAASGRLQEPRIGHTKR